MEMWSMGGYGAYVWTSYALTLGVVLACVVQGKRRHRRVVRELRARLSAVERNK